MLRPYSFVPRISILAIQQGAHADPDSPIAVETDEVGLVRRIRHEIRVSVQPYGEQLAEPMPYADLSSNATVVRLVGPGVRVPHVSDPRKDLGATRGRHVIDEPHMQRLMGGAVLRGVGDVHLDRQERERVRTNPSTESERI